MSTRPAPKPSVRRRLLRVASYLSAAIAVLLVLEGVLVLTWKEPVTSFLQDRKQAGLERQLEQARDSFRLADEAGVSAPGATPDAGSRTPRAGDETPAAPTPIAPLVARVKQTVSPGDAVMKIDIPAIGVSQVVVEGTGTQQLRAGPGRYAQSALPGEGRTTGVAGHRTTWGAPFRRVNELERGDEIAVQTSYGDYSYSVEGVRIVDADDWSVIADTGSDRLVLTACHPLYSSSQRIVVTAGITTSAAEAEGTASPR